VLLRGGRREAELPPLAEGEGDSLFMPAETGVGIDGEDVVGVVTSWTLPRAMD
jgi:hypothetical protein